MTTLDTLAGAPPATTPSTVGELAELADAVDRYREATRSEATLVAYRRDWRHFAGWCEAHGAQALPASPAVLELYVADQAAAGFHSSTIARRLAAISAGHQEAGLSTPTKDPTVLEVLKGIRRVHGVASRRVATPVVTADLRRMVDGLPAGLLGVRDRALLLVGFAGAFRRSELVALDVADVTDTADGLVIVVRSSKTDQEGVGRKIGVPYGSQPATCPVRAVRAWKDAAHLEAGPLWRSVSRHGHLGGRLPAAAVAQAVKRAAARAGLDPAAYSGHSLRSGLATAAAAAGVSERSIMNQTGHTNLPMVRRYIRDGSLFRDNAAAQVGL